MRWIVLLLLFTGCASTHTKVTVTRAHGEPVISVEFYEHNDGNNRNKDRL